MSKTLQRIVPWVIVFRAAATPVMAQEEEPQLDARLVGYGSQQTVTRQTSSTATAWLVLVGLGLVCAGPLFLNAHRTHLD